MSKVLPWLFSSVPPVATGGRSILRGQWGGLLRKQGEGVLLRVGGRCAAAKRWVGCAAGVGGKGYAASTSISLLATNTRLPQARRTHTLPGLSPALLTNATTLSTGRPRQGASPRQQCAALSLSPPSRLHVAGLAQCAPTPAVGGRSLRGNCVRCCRGPRALCPDPCATPLPPSPLLTTRFPPPTTSRTPRLQARRLAHRPPAQPFASACDPAPPRPGGQRPCSGCPAFR